MNSHLDAVIEMHKFFTRERIQYAIIGGIAVQWWGEPRFTRDIDVTILVDADKEKKVLQKILSHFSPRLTQALDFALKNRVCLVKNKQGVDIDISLGVPGYEDECMERVILVPIQKKSAVKICSAEDLIIHKALAGRPQDVADIESIILRQGKKLDVHLIRKWLKEFAFLLEKKEILEVFQIAWKKFQRRP